MIRRIVDVVGGDYTGEVRVYSRGGDHVATVFVNRSSGWSTVQVVFHVDVGRLGDPLLSSVARAFGWLRSWGLHMHHENFRVDMAGPSPLMILVAGPSEERFDAAVRFVEELLEASGRIPEAPLLVEWLSAYVRDAWVDALVGALTRAYVPLYLYQMLTLGGFAASRRRRRIRLEVSVIGQSVVAEYFHVEEFDERRIAKLRFETGGLDPNYLGDVVRIVRRVAGRGLRGAFTHLSD